LNGNVRFNFPARIFDLIVKPLLASSKLLSSIKRIGQASLELKTTFELFVGHKNLIAFPEK
jgi:hypothetical protein